MVRRRESRNLCWSVGRGDLCCVKRRRDSRGGTDIAVAVCPAVSAVCAGCPFGAFQNGYLRRSPRSTLDNRAWLGWWRAGGDVELHRSEEHTSELQSLTNLVCRL